MDRTDRDWERWGATEPFFGVLTGERYRLASIDENRDEFFATGDHLVETVLHKLETTFGPIDHSSALDYGCGVGRLTQALAKRFERVDGLDISPSMLRHAIAVPNVRYHLADDALTAAAPDYSLVFCYIVLQHIQPARGMRLIEQLLGRVADGGGAFIHVSFELERSRVRNVASFVRAHVPGGNGVINRLRGRPWSEPQMRMGHYSLAAILDLFRRHGFSSVLVVPEDHDGALTAGFIGRR